jgi:hypothetical protein
MATVANDFNLNFNMFKDSLLAQYFSYIMVVSFVGGGSK